MTLYTIGHSDHSIPDFVSLLRRYGVTLVVDVRSQPYSRWMHQFNRELLAHDLRESQIDYRFMGDGLGGRPDDPSLYDPGQERPDYDRLEQTPQYQAGLDALIELARSATVAVMCSEGDYRQCHRHLLLTQSLLARDCDVVHIQPDGTALPGSLIPRQLSLFG
jgi:uncharacterized protein (DUF488 family)